MNGPEIEDAPPPAEAKTPEMIAGELIAKHGTPEKALAVVVKENARVRRLNRELKASPPSASSAPLADGDAEDLATYRAFGKPDNLKEALGELSGFRRAKELEGFAAVAGYDPAKVAVMAKFAGDDAKFATVTSPAGKLVVTVSLPGKETENADVFFKDILPALKSGAAPMGKGTPNRAGHAGTRFPATGGELRPGSETPRLDQGAIKRSLERIGTYSAF